MTYKFAKQTVKDLTSYRLNVLMTYKKTAFTLAEVLITLGIIGVVAALTIPSLVAKYQMKSFEVAFKKQYSVLNNTINFLQLEQGIRECYLTNVLCPTEGNPGNMCYSSNNSECLLLKQGMIDKLKLTPIKNDFSYPSGSQVKAEGGVLVNGTLDYPVNGLSAYILPDGAVVMFQWNDGYEYQHTTVVVDVNGKKGPNKWGYDAYFLTLTLKNNNIRLTDEYASLANKGGRLPRTMLMNKDANESTGRLWN